MFGFNKTTPKFCDLKGKVAIVTGAGKGMGEADAIKLAGAGAKVVLADIDVASCQIVAEKIKKDRGEALVVKCDQSKKVDVENVVKETLKKFGKIDILVNNAGIYPFQPFLEMKEEQFEKVIDINLKGYFLMAQACAKEMAKQKKGVIVNITSVAMGQIGLGFAGLTHYCASKGGITAMSEAMALELAPMGIRINCLAPGAIDTPGTHTMEMNEKTKESMVSVVPMKRWGKSEEIANAVLFLVSDESSYMTGSVVIVDGGWCAG